MLETLGRAALADGDPAGAETLFRRSLRESWAMGALPQLLRTLFRVAELRCEQGHPDGAAYLARIVAGHPAASEPDRKLALALLATLGQSAARGGGVAFPEVPTLEEQGFPGFDDVTWTAMFFPAATPAAILAKANADCALALEDAATRRRLEAVGFDSMGGSLEATSTYVAREIARWGDVVRAVGVTLD